jgi:imidazolonepropionase-like amidohydrolase
VSTSVFLIRAGTEPTWVQTVFRALPGRLLPQHSPLVLQQYTSEHTGCLGRGPRPPLSWRIVAGIKIRLGTDAAVYRHRLNAHELAVYVRLEMTPLQAIQTTTINDAGLLSWSDHLAAQSGQVRRHHRHRLRSAEGHHRSCRT